MRYRYALPLFFLLFVPLTFAQDAAKAVDPQSLIGFVSDSIRWFREGDQGSQVTDPEDAMFVSARRQLARDYLRSAFEYARVQAARVDSANSVPGAAAKLSGTLQQSFNQTSSQLNESQRALASVEDQLANSSGQKRRVLEAQRDELKSEIALAQARLEILQTFVNYRQAADNGLRGKQSLTAQVEELEQTVAELRASALGKDPQATKTETAGDKSSSASAGRSGEEEGLLGAISSLFTLREKLSALNDQARSTAALRDNTRKLIAPLRSELADATQRGSSISAGAPVGDIAVLKQQKVDLDALTQTVKKTSAIALPLGRAGLLLDSYQTNLGEWRKHVEAKATGRLRYVGVRLAFLAAVIGVILLLSAAWRRATLKYVADVRRQNQILLVRRIVVAILILFVLAITLLSEVAALATYAGLVTAGLAVALQNIILSVIAYFFLIGRYGVHIGDRVTISGITGKVSEIGLLRFHLLELQGEETDLHLSGRVVVFSNAVILQPTSHFFKQAPASDFLWHEMKLTCEPNSNYWELEGRLRKALESVYANQAHGAEDHGFKLSSGKLPSPVVKVMIGQNGVIIVVRYAVYAYGSTDLDEQVTRTVLSITHRTEGVELSAPESLQTESSNA